PLPGGPLAGRWAGRYVMASEMRRVLDAVVESWPPRARGSDAAQTFAVRLRDGREGLVGFITPMSCSFCDACDRVRIAADGTVYPCLMDAPSHSVRPALRPVYHPERLDVLLRDALARKAPAP